MTYEQIASALGISRMAVYDAEKRAFYKILLFLLDEYDCDFEALGAAIGVPLDRFKKAFLKLHAYYHHAR